jgi:hypothetical protein
MQSLRRGSLLSLTYALVACGGQVGARSVLQAEVAAVVTLDPDTPMTVFPGAIQTLTATSSDGTNLTWSMSPELGSLTPSGEVASGDSVTYEAPWNVSGTQEVTLTATADSGPSGAVTITIEGR